MISITRAIQSPIDAAIKGGISSSGSGLVFPPVRDKLLIWANGQIQDGAYVWQDPDDVQDPDAPFGIWRKDKQTDPTEYSMKVSQSHCCTFNGVDDAIQAPYFGDYLSPTYKRSLSCTFDAINQSDYDCVLRIRTAVVYTTFFIYLVPNTGIVAFRHTQSNGTAVSVLGPTVAPDQVCNITCEANGTNLILTVNGEVFTQTYDGTIYASTGSSMYLSDMQFPHTGKIWNVKFSDDIIFPLAEGSGNKVYSTDGLHSGTNIGTGNLWSSYQDDYHYNVANGFWMNGDGVKYPYPVSGFTSVHPAGKWNGAENKYVYRDDAILLAADALEGPFLNVPRTQAEIEAYCVGKASVFWRDCGDYGELSQYDEILTGSELSDVALYNCIADKVQYQVQDIAYNGNIITYTGA